MGGVAGAGRCAAMWCREGISMQGRCREVEVKGCRGHRKVEILTRTKK